MQGRVASEISTGDELVLTELVFSGFFKELPVTHLCAVLSCFVWQEKSQVWGEHHGCRTGNLLLVPNFHLNLSPQSDASTQTGAKVPPAMERAYAGLRDAARYDFHFEYAARVRVVCDRNTYAYRRKAAAQLIFHSIMAGASEKWRSSVGCKWTWKSMCLHSAPR